MTDAFGTLDVRVALVVSIDGPMPERPRPRPAIWQVRRGNFLRLIPHVYDEMILDWRAETKMNARGERVPFAIEATSIEAARHLAPRGLAMHVDDAGNVWFGPEEGHGALPRAPLPSMPVRTLEGAAANGKRA